MCRILQALEAGIRAIEYDPSGRKYLQQQGKQNLLAETRAAFDASKKQMPRECFHEHTSRCRCHQLLGEPITDSFTIA